MTTSNIVRQQFVHRGLRLSYLDSAPGDARRPVILLLHGFPDEAAMWIPIIPGLHAAGFRVLAADTVGCGQSEMATRRDGYDIFRIVGDVVALLDQLGVQQAQIAGHDWGAVLAWFLAMHQPQRVQRLCVMSVGHPAAYVGAGLRQKLMGWYIVYFHMAGLSERLLMGRGWFSLRRVFGSHPEMESVMDRLRNPGRLTAALRIYRANIFQHVLFGRHPRVRCPVLGLYSVGDAFLDAGQMRDSQHWVDSDFSYVALAGGHWLPLEQLQRVQTLMLEHFAAGDAAADTNKPD
ncbi:MAG: alpha/beta fold hydrolase [Stagnimonas sp.]|nr:alpha/beta fold hydrolase [Stagnimonas sp.]